MLSPGLAALSRSDLGDLFPTLWASGSPCVLGGPASLASYSFRNQQDPQPWTEPGVAGRYPLLLTDLRQSLQLLVLDDLGLLVLLDDHLHLHLHRQDVS